MTICHMEKAHACLPGAMVLLKVGSSQPHTLLTGKHLQGVGINGPGTLQRPMGHTLKHNTNKHITEDDEL